MSDYCFVVYCYKTHSGCDSILCIAHVQAKDKLIAQTCLDERAVPRSGCFMCDTDDFCLWIDLTKMFRLDPAGVQKH